MYAGKRQKVVLQLYRKKPEPIWGRLATARVIEQQDNECTIEAEVYGKGIIMWLLSQGSKVEVLKPESMRDEMKLVLHEMLSLYEQSYEGENLLPNYGRRFFYYENDMQCHLRVIE